MAKAAGGGRQTSRKSGVVSTAQKLDSTRHGFRSEPAAHKVAGAFGKEGRTSRRNAGGGVGSRKAATVARSLKSTARTTKRKERAD